MQNVEKLEDNDFKLYSLIDFSRVKKAISTSFKVKNSILIPFITILTSVVLLPGIYFQIEEFGMENLSIILTINLLLIFFFTTFMSLTPVFDIFAEKLAVKFKSYKKSSIELVSLFNSNKVLKNIFFKVASHPYKANTKDHYLLTLHTLFKNIDNNQVTFEDIKFFTETVKFIEWIASIELKEKEKQEKMDELKHMAFIKTNNTVNGNSVKIQPISHAEQNKNENSFLEKQFNFNK